MPDDVGGRFRSHKHYVEAFCWLAGKTTFTRSGVALQTVATTADNAALSDKAPRSINLEQVHRSLRNAWSTEVLIGLPGQWADDQDEFIRLANSWGVVQAYYVGYHVTQALHVAKGNRRPTSHPQTQNLYASLWVDRPLALAPWSFGVDHSGWRNLPANIAIDDTVHPWTNCSPATCWSLAAKALRTTRDAQVRSAIQTKRGAGLRQRKRQWQQEEASRLADGRRPRTTPVFRRPNLTQTEKKACDKSVRTYTVLDYLYRLRIGANYDDASVFTDGPEDDTDSYMLHVRLAFLAASMALVAEARIRDLVGATVFRRWADDFAASNIPPTYSFGIKERRPLL